MTDMTDTGIKIWDSGKDNDGRYTIKYGNRVFIYGHDNTGSEPTIILSPADIDEAWLNKHFKTITPEQINSNIIASLYTGKA